MSDSASRRAADVDSQAVFDKLDKVVAETNLTAERKQESVLDSEAATATAEAAAKPNLRVVTQAPGIEDGLGSVPDQAALTLFEEEEKEEKEEEAQKEKEVHGHTHGAPFRRIAATQLIIAALAIIAITEFVFLMSKSSVRAPAASAPQTGIVAIESTPAGALITIDGQTRDITPSTLTLSPGKYAMTLTRDGVARDIPLIVRAGNNSARVYFSDASTASSAQPSITGMKGETPATAVPVPATSPPANAVGGWLSVTSPVELQLFERGAFIGSSQSDRIMLPVGRHVIDATNSALGYTTSSTVQVAPGSVARFSPEMPNGTLNVNATPWADVTIDGKPLGTTPLGNLSLPIGPHDVVFTHPQLGERRQAILVTLNGVNRISVNLSQR